MVEACVGVLEGSGHLSDKNHRTWIYCLVQIHSDICRFASLALGSFSELQGSDGLKLYGVYGTLAKVGGYLANRYKMLLYSFR